MTNDQKKICLITPSYAPDFERCQLLVRSIDRYNLAPCKQYIIVDRKDRSIFKQLENDRTVMLITEELLPQWLFRLPLVRLLTKKNLWFSWKTLPVRGWLVQQLIKLSVAEHIEEDILVFADSDVFFVKNFDLNDYVRDDLVRLFAQSGRVNPDSPDLPQWYYDASKLLGIDPPQFPATNYLGSVIFWRRDNVLKLHRYLEEKNQRDWKEVVCANWNFSEYILYGVFVEKILQEKSGHYFDDYDLCHNYWKEQSLETDQIKDFIDSVPPATISAMFSAKANISLSSYRGLIGL
jgi:hypothetical protein